MLSEGIVGNVGQRKALGAMSPEMLQRFEASEQQDLEQQKLASLGGSLVGGSLAGGVRPSISNIKDAAQGIASMRSGVRMGALPPQQSGNIVNVAGGAALNTGIEAGHQIARGQFDPLSLAAAPVAGAVFNQPTALGRLYGFHPTSPEAAPQPQPDQVITPEGQLITPTEAEVRGKQREAIARIDAINREVAGVVQQGGRIETPVISGRVTPSQVEAAAGYVPSGPARPRSFLSADEAAAASAYPDSAAARADKAKPPRGVKVAPETTEATGQPPSMEQRIAMNREALNRSAQEAMAREAQRRAIAAEAEQVMRENIAREQARQAEIAARERAWQELVQATAPPRGTFERVRTEAAPVTEPVATPEPVAAAPEPAPTPTPPSTDVPYTYKGYQEGFGKIPGQHLYDLTQNLGPHPKGSTVTGDTLRNLGFEVKPPEAAAPKPATELTPKEQVKILSNEYNTNLKTINAATTPVSEARRLSAINEKLYAQIRDIQSKYQPARTPIRAAAFHDPETGKVYDTGYFHQQTAEMPSNPIIQKRLIAGFLTDDGRFLTRREAAALTGEIPNSESMSYAKGKTPQLSTYESGGYQGRVLPGKTDGLLQPSDASTIGRVTPTDMRRASVEASRRGVTLGRAELPVNTPEGQRAAGVAYRNRMAAVDPAVATRDTPFHEVLHPFIEDLRGSSHPKDREIVAMGERLLGGNEQLTQRAGEEYLKLVDREASKPGFRQRAREILADWRAAREFRAGTATPEQAGRFVANQSRLRRNFGGDEALRGQPAAGTGGVLANQGEDGERYQPQNLPNPTNLEEVANLIGIQPTEQRLNDGTKYKTIKFKTAQHTVQIGLSLPDTHGDGKSHIWVSKKPSESWAKGGEVRKGRPKESFTQDPSASYLLKLAAERDDGKQYQPATLPPHDDSSGDYAKNLASYLISRKDFRKITPRDEAGGIYYPDTGKMEATRGKPEIAQHEVIHKFNADNFDKTVAIGRKMLDTFSDRDWMTLTKLFDRFGETYKHIGDVTFNLAKQPTMGRDLTKNQLFKLADEFTAQMATIDPVFKHRWHKLIDKVFGKSGAFFKGNLTSDLYAPKYDAENDKFYQSASLPPRETYGKTISPTEQPHSIIESAEPEVISADDKLATHVPNRAQQIVSSAIDKVRYIGGKDAPIAVRKIANYAADSLQEIFRLETRYNGKYREPFSRAVEAAKLTEAESIKLGQYRRDMANKGSSDLQGWYDSDPNIQRFNEAFANLLVEARLEQNVVGPDIRTLDGGRKGKIDPYYDPAIVNQRVRRVVTDNQTTPESQQLRTELEDYWYAKLLRKNPNATPAQKTALRKQITNEADDYIQALGKFDQGNERTFAALRRAEGYGLPDSWVDPSIVNRGLRYFARYAKDMAYFRAVENNPVARSIFNIPDQSGSKELNAAALPDGTPIDKTTNAVASNKFTAKAIDSSVRYQSDIESVVFSGSRLVTSGWLGPWSGARDIASSFIHNLPYAKTTDLARAFIPAFQDFKRYYEASFGSGVNRSKVNAIEFGTESINQLSDWMNTKSDQISQLQGRNLLEKVTRGVQFGLGVNVARLVLARGNFVEADKFLRMFGKGLKNPKQYIGKSDIPDHVLNELAAQWVEHNQGTYDARGLPSGAVKGQFAGLLALARWGIEKQNTMYKDVWLPAKLNRDIMPLLRVTLGAALGGEAIRQLGQVINNRLDFVPDWNELTEADNAGAEDIAANLVTAANMSGYFGITSQMAYDVIRMGSGRPPQGFVTLPALDYLSETLIHHTTDFINALHNKEPLDRALLKYTHVMLKDTVQSYRIAANHTIDAADQERKKGIRNIAVFRDLEGRTVNYQTFKPQQITGLSAREFDRAENLADARKHLPAAVDVAVKRSEGEPEALRRNFQTIARQQDTRLPNPETPEGRRELVRYKNFIIRTQGEAAWDKLLNSYVAKKQLDAEKKNLFRQFLAQNRGEIRKKYEAVGMRN